MSHKTKAAMQGRQCHYQKLKQSQDTRVNAGGQSLSAPVITGTAPLARLRCTALPHTQSPETSGELEQSAGCTAMQHTPEESRSFDRYPDNGYHSLLASLAFLRWRRLISPRIEVTINCDVLSSLSLTSSIASTTSCGTLAFRACDFAFFVPVAITESPLYWWATVYTKKGDRKALTWATPCNYSGPHLDFVKVKNNEAPRVSLPLAELLTNNRYHGAKNG
ncbi:hypothetical protein ILZ95_003163 [Escherichia coli]|nr:hypothetical protein [Escherichia coli]EHI7025958.1 hypothetical protein [Escherichia coli]EHP6441397.1 hypothetical protein [Escherichia coli]EIT7486413.1 hypothetical protein [Escherichia coli]EMD6907147.1 hypothetical protein [Citrobacter freundii]